MTPQAQVQEKCKQVIEAAKRIYNVDLSVVRVGFNLKGRVAGWAQWKRRLGVASYTVRFNHDMIVRGDAEVLRDMVEDTVPHEFAHIVCYMRPELGKNHDGGWQRVCVALGGTGKRTHDLEVVYGKGATYEYTTDRGHKVRMSERHHKKVQAGIPLRYRKGLGTVTQTCAYSIVGVQGRTLAQPIVKQAANHPDQVEMARRQAMVDELRRRQQLVTNPVQRPTPAVTPAATVAPRILPPAPGESKAAVSRRIMLSGFRSGQSYEQIINAMIAANGYDRQLARGTFKANAPKVGIPASFYL
jgi:predicted SprT family Zn-dependent metalloprotease